MKYDTYTTMAFFVEVRDFDDICHTLRWSAIERISENPYDAEDGETYEFTTIHLKSGKVINTKIQYSNFKQYFK